MQKIVNIVGPTAVGKTDLALKLAQKFRGAIVSADSVQVFKDLNIISGKDLPKGYIFYAGCYSRISSPSIYLLDVVEPTSKFSVADFYHKATFAIDEISKKGDIPIIVGGTGLYVQTLLNGLAPGMSEDSLLREKLNTLTVFQLQKLIPSDTLDSMNESDRNNKRRLIRKIETMGNNKTEDMSKSHKYESLVIGLTCDRQTLRQRIDTRVDERLKEGAMKEAEGLFKMYKNLAQQIKDANGYKQLFKYLKGEADLDEAIYRWKISEYRHAKNQMTWFRKYGNVEWFDVVEKNAVREIEKKVKNFLA